MMKITALLTLLTTILLLSGCFFGEPYDSGYHDHGYGQDYGYGGNQQPAPQHRGRRTLPN